MTTMYLDLIGGPARSRDDIIADILQNCPVDTREEAEEIFEGALADGQIVEDVPDQFKQKAAAKANEATDALLKLLGYLREAHRDDLAAAVSDAIYSIDGIAEELWPGSDR